jgi:hypothetical protein
MVSVVNGGLWTFAAVRFASASADRDAAKRRLDRREVWLSAGYVAICAFRSVFPRADVQRICLFDTWLSSVLVGRTVATIAELCFVAQWALLLHALARTKESAFAINVSRIVVPLIAIAEVFSWYAVVSTNYLGNVVEESIWASTGALLVISLLILWPRCSGALRRGVALAIASAAFYVAFMSLVDVPMYVSRWRADEAAGRPYLSLGDGFFDLAHRWIVTRTFSDWREEMPWMALYFSVAVWISIALTRVPDAWLDHCTSQKP